MRQLQRSIETYIQAKDGNRPHLMADAFTQDAVLQMHVKTAAIAFPATSHGVQAIADVLVSEFGRRYENVYTFCIGAPPANDEAFDCDWIVVMTEKGSGLVRAGFGRYQWRCSDATGMVSSLAITIEEMAVLPATQAAPTLQWACRLPYPWCPGESLMENTPGIGAIESIAKTLAVVHVERLAETIELTAPGLTQAI